jgi:hypothetical protein
MWTERLDYISKDRDGNRGKKRLKYPRERKEMSDVGKLEYLRGETEILV